MGDSSSPWFSEELRCEEYLGVCKKEGTASRIVASLGVLALSLPLRAFFPTLEEGVRMRVRVVPSVTNNRGNGAVLNKLMSCRFSLSAVLMEFGRKLRHSGVRPDV